MKNKIKKNHLFYIFLSILSIIGLQKIYYQYQKNHTYEIDKTGISDNSYAKNIKIQHFIMTPEQVAKLLKDK